MLSEDGVVHYTCTLIQFDLRNHRQHQPHNRWGRCASCVAELVLQAFVVVQSDTHPRHFDPWPGCKSMELLVQFDFPLKYHDKWKMELTNKSSSYLSKKKGNMMSAENDLIWRHRYGFNVLFSAFLYWFSLFHAVWCYVFMEMIKSWSRIPSRDKKYLSWIL